MVILTALRSASNASRSDIISAVAPPSFYLYIQVTTRNQEIYICKFQITRKCLPGKTGRNPQDMPCKECFSLSQCSYHLNPADNTNLLLRKRL